MELDNEDVCTSRERACSNECIGDDANATHYCEQCSKFLCQLCVLMHSQQRATIGHTLVFMQEQQSEAGRGALVRPTSHTVQAGYDNSLFAALKALASVELVACKQGLRNYVETAGMVQQSIQRARSVALAAFQSTCDSQSTKYSQAWLVRLQMCEDVEGVAQELFRGAFGSSSRDHSHSCKAAVETMCNVWHRRYDMLDSEFARYETLISLHAILLSLSPHPELLEKHLCLAAKIAMKQGNMSFARGSMQKLQMWAASQSDPQRQGHPRAWWIRDAKVLVSVLLPACKACRHRMPRARAAPDPLLRLSLPGLRVCLALSLTVKGATVEG